MFVCLAYPFRAPVFSDWLLELLSPNVVLSSWWQMQRLISSTNGSSTSLKQKLKKTLNPPKTETKESAVSSINARTSPQLNPHIRHSQLEVFVPLGVPAALGGLRPQHIPRIEGGGPGRTSLDLWTALAGVLRGILGRAFRGGVLEAFQDWLHHG